MRVRRVAKTVFAFGCVALFIVMAWVASSTGQTADNQSVARGRYVVMIAGCNDCHTVGFTESGGKTPEREWLTGSPVGWRGPWGTTYAANIRMLLENLSEDGWVSWARTAQTQPPMPYWALNAMHDDDLRAMYRFIRSLGPGGGPTPPGLPPGQTPTTPFIQFPGAS